MSTIAEPVKPQQFNSFRQRLEQLVDLLPGECDAQMPLKRPRFVHAVLLLANQIGENGGEMKVSLKKQLDSDLNDKSPENDAQQFNENKRRIQEKIEFFEAAKKGEFRKANIQNLRQNGNAKLSKTPEEVEQLLLNDPLFDAIAEAVRILREAREMLDERLNRICQNKNGLTYINTATNAMLKSPLLEQNEEPPQKDHDGVEMRQRPQRLLSPSSNGMGGFLFPSEMRKFRTTKIES